MITAETVNSIVRFQVNGLPVVSLYCRVDPGASRREVRARVQSLLDQIRPLAKDYDLDHLRYRPVDAHGHGRVRWRVTVSFSPVPVVGRERPGRCTRTRMLEVQAVTDPLRQGGQHRRKPPRRTGSRTGWTTRPQAALPPGREHDRPAVAQRRIRRASSSAATSTSWESSSRFPPHELRGRVAVRDVREKRRSTSPPRWPRYAAARRRGRVMRRYQHEHDQRLVAHVAGAGPQAARAGCGRPRGLPPVGTAAGCPPSTHAAATRRRRPWPGWSVTSPAGWRPPGTSARSAGSPPGTPRTSWTSSRRPSSRSAARPGRSRRTSCQTSTRRRRSFGSLPPPPRGRAPEGRGASPP